MKNMKMKYGSLATVCLLLLVLLPASCIKDEYATKEKATVRVTFTTKAISGDPNTTAGDLEEYEHMRTLRVIVARASDNDILYNVKYNIEENEISKTITFSELTVNEDGEDFVFYAIANEKGTGYDDWESVSVATLKDRVLANIITLNGGNVLIPQTAYRIINVGKQVTGDTTIPLQFAVAKVRLTIENTSTAEQTVSNICLYGVNTTSTPLFAGTNLSGKKDDFVDLGNMVIPAGKSNTVYAYFYENTGGNYALNATWNGLKTLNFGSGTNYDIGSISRGTELDINVTLSANTTAGFEVQVNKWGEKTMDVPAFE